jgi:peptidoglycan L-alanyl-D-glutamate endopeptidase CwlK
MGFHLSARSRENLRGVDGDLIDVVNYAIQITEVDFAVTEGLRTVERQEKLFKAGASKTMNSRHLIGHAVDVVAMVDGRITWSTQPYFKIAEAMKKAADELDIAIEWGGDWETFKDYPHFQLSRGTHP